MTKSFLHKKIQSQSKALQCIQSWRRQGDRIVWTNGCFDLLHVGHLTYLAEASTLGDHLVVGVNDDESVRHLKGENRPINKLIDRQMMLAALEFVDLVVSFEEATPLQIICELKPDLIIKGGDYIPAQVVGREEARAWGGEVKILPFQKGYSSSQIIDKIRGL